MNRPERLEQETVKRIRARGKAFSTSDRLSREELHDRHAIR